MKLLINKSNPKEAIILAFGEDDVKTLQMLHTNSIVFGMYSVWTRQDDRPIEKLDAQIQPIVIRFPSVDGIAFLNIVKGFVPAVPKVIE
jgi:hypothetical protein